VKIKVLSHRISLVLLSIFLTAPAHFAQASLKDTIIISDVDDTIQHTQVRPADDSYLAKTKHIFKLARNVLKNHDAFIGMSQLYMMLAEQGAEFHYVSGAPKSILRLPEKFLQTAGFPVGELSVRPDARAQTTAQFKLERIAEILDANPGKNFILIGDNGERDVTVYDKLQAMWRFKGRIQQVYIHDLYPKPIGEKVTFRQIPFLTAADLALQFQEDKMITTEQVREVVDLVKQALDSEYDSIRQRAYPKYATLDKRNLQAIAYEVGELKDPSVRATMVTILKRLSERLVGSSANKCGILF
jgi:phosphatidate phosphatase APP1